MKIILHPNVKAVIENLGNKTIQNSGLKIYTAIYLRNKRSNKHGYFDCPSTFLKTINDRYAKIIDKFEANNIIRCLKNVKPDPNDIFNRIITKSYSADLGYCMQYKFLIDITFGEEIEVDFKANVFKRWYSIIADSLTELGYTPKITRDSFGRRVHHPLIKTYKTFFKDKGYYVIDAKASQPTLLYLIMKTRNILDTNYIYTFENNLDFYEFVSEKLGLQDRVAAKSLFMFWINSRGYVPDAGIHKLFPLASAFIKGLKEQNYKDSPAFLQREEARIWIDDLLENIPANFALPVHDSLIVKEKDFAKVLSYCQTKYPELRFSTKPL